MASTIIARLVQGDAVTLPNLAKFEVRDRPARQVRNVATGEMINRCADKAVNIFALTATMATLNKYANEDPRP